MAKEVENIVELRQGLLESYNKLRGGEIGIREAKEEANLAGKIISTAKLQLEYNAYMKSSSRIAFLDV